MTSHPTKITAASLLDSVGVCTHLSYPDEVYGAQPALMLDHLKALGVRHTRDGIIDPASYKAKYALPYLDGLRASGIRQCLLLGNPGAKYGEPGTSEAQRVIDYLRSPLYAGSYDALEGPNEQDIFGTGTDWVSTTHAFMAAYYKALKADPVLRGFPVLGPALGHSKNYPAYGTDTNNDVGNAHTYAGGNYPEGSGGGLSIHLNAVRAMVGPGKPIYSTEFGWQTAQGLSWHVDDSTAAAYLLRALVNNLDQGIARSYIYELYDSKPDTATGSAQTDAEKHFGLYWTRGTGTGSTAAKAWTTEIKPQGASLRNLLGRLKESSTSTPPSSVSYDLSGAPADVRAVPIVRRSGAYDIALWRALPLWQSGAPVRPAAVPVRLTIPSPRLVHTFRPDTGKVVSLSAYTSRVDVKVDGLLTLVRVG